MPIQTSNPNKLKIVGLTVLVGLFVFGLTYLGTLFWPRDSYVLKKPITLLLIGMDINVASPESSDISGGVPRTDTLILTLIDPKTTKITLISVPRDSLVHIPGAGVGRINQASTIGGYSLTKRMVQRLTGCKIDHYMVVNFESFKRLVDMVGGVKINVDKKMRYANEYGEYKIKLDPGWQVLDGDTALQFVRFRNEPLGDISRVERQRRFLIALYKKLKRPGNIVKIPQLINIGRKYVKTDLNTQELLQLLNLARAIDPEKDISSYTLPGYFSDVYWQPDRIQVNALMAKVLPKQND